ncbi:hypothetical protein NESM_000263500 [Novymonas esmeraldas]|uniref:Ubiquitin-like domain-containing protein n=1 Tax=Novymonas esmeraldas TaxID=1808958 RepID=A0AAW0FAL9_9TRYP
MSTYSDSDSGDEWAAPPQPSAGSGARAATVAAAPVTEASEAGGGRSMEAMDAVERDLAGAAVPVLFQLPGGGTHAASFFMGQSVEHMKVHLEQAVALPYERTTLYLADRQLLDPLSLSDLPFDSKVENTVRVELAA